MTHRPDFDYIELEHRAQTLRIYPEKALGLPTLGALVIADLHFGKASHFRKNGIAVPAQAELENLHRLEAVLEQSQASRLLIAGDAFHSHANRSLDLFAKWRDHLGPDVTVELVTGNHDILPAETYRQLGILALGPMHVLGPYTLIHDPAHAPTSMPDKPPAEPPSDAEPIPYYLSGHLHPGVYLPTGGRGQTLPALVLGQSQGLLPSFGGFTGLANVRPELTDIVCVFGEGKVFRIS